MRELTLKEEYDILWALNGEEPMGNGTSRVVFDCPVDLADQLNLDSNYHYVIKLDYGVAGRNQMTTEVNFFKNCENSDSIKYLARIVAVGKFMTIMEYVEVIDYLFEFINGEDLIEYDEHKIDGRINQLSKIETDFTKTEIKDMYNQTIKALKFWYMTQQESDGIQVGLTEDKRVVLYDYAINSIETPCFISNTCLEMWGGELVQNFISVLRTLVGLCLKKEKDFLDNSNNLQKIDSLVEQEVERCFEDKDYVVKQNFDI